MSEPDTSPQATTPAKVRGCTVCLRLDVAGINEALDRGDSLRAIERAHGGVSKSALARHKAGCLGDVSEAPSDRGTAGGTELGEGGTAASEGASAGTDERAKPAKSEKVSQQSQDAGSFEENQTALFARTRVFPEPSKPSGTASGTDAGQRGTTGAEMWRAADVRTDEAYVAGLVKPADRVMYVADLASDGKWLGRRTARWLAGLWGVARTTVEEWARLANILTAADAATIELRRQTSIEDTRKLRDLALESVELDEEGHVSPPDVKAAIAAQAHLDKIQGVLVNAPPQINVALFERPEVSTAIEQAMSVVRAVLERLHPDAVIDVQAGLNAWSKGGSEGLRRMLDEREVNRGCPALVESTIVE